MEEETSYLLHILFLLSFLSKGLGRHCIFRLKPTAKPSQSLRLENAQPCCKEEGLSQTHSSASLGTCPELERKGYQTWVPCLWFSREWHHRLESPAKYNDTICNINLTLAPSQAADKGRMNRAERREGTQGEGMVGVGCGVQARDEMFSEPALCWALNTLYLLSFTFQTSVPHPYPNVLFLKITWQYDFHVLMFNFISQHPSFFFNIEI